MLEKSNKMNNKEAQKITELKNRHNFNQQQWFPVGFDYRCALRVDNVSILMRLYSPAIQEYTIILYLRSVLLVVYYCYTSTSDFVWIYVQLFQVLCQSSDPGLEMIKYDTF